MDNALRVRGDVMATRIVETDGMKQIVRVIITLINVLIR